MTEKEHLLKIVNLNIAGKIEHMDDLQLNEYVQALNSFIEKYPALEEKFKTVMEEKDYDFVLEGLIAVCDMLGKIHADVLAEEGMKQINNLKDMDPGKNEAYITNFLAAVSMLSIDIQMAMFYKEQKEEKQEKQEKEETKPAPEKKADAPKNKRTSILAVDYVTFFLSSLQALLKDSGYVLTCVNSGEAALKFLRDNTPDLFLLDIDMPNMNGYELARKIKASGQTAPIIFLTANSSHHHVIKAIESGAVDFIVKPINKAQVTSKIEKVLRAARSK